MTFSPSIVRRAALCLAVIGVALLTSQAWAEITWISTTESEPWKTQPAPEMVAARDAAPDIVLVPSKPLQEIDGFGGCFNELGWKALSGLSDEARRQVIASLFSDDGCAFTVARTPIGASDFALDYYSLNDNAGDYGMEKFSIERDRQCLIRYIKAAMEIRPKLRLWASAWTPPAWMKEDGQYHGGRIRKDPQTLRAYANYLARYVEAYRKEGLDLTAVAVQNEPHMVNKYPTCLWSGAEMRDFVRDYMGPVFAQRKPGADIWLGTINDRNYPYAVAPVMDDPAASAYIKAITFQWDGQDIIADAHALFPGMRLVQSENECHAGKNSFADAERTFFLFRKYMNGGANSYYFWNMVLQPDGKSSWGWAQNAMINVDAASGAVKYNPEFYVMKHVAHFVPPGSHLAYSTGTWGDRIGFVRQDGSTVIIVGNSANRDLPTTLGVPGDNKNLIRVTLPSHSLNTFVFPGNAK